MSDKLGGSPIEVAEKLGTDRNYIEALVREGRIPYVRLGPRKVVIPWRALDEWLNTEARQNLRTDNSPSMPPGLVVDN